MTSTFVNLRMPLSASGSSEILFACLPSFVKVVMLCFSPSEADYATKFTFVDCTRLSDTLKMNTAKINKIAYAV